MGSTLITPGRNGTRPERLSDQQLVFINELAADEKFNKSAAAKKAGYKNPANAAGKLLCQPKILAALRRALRDRVERCELQADRVVTEVGFCALRDPIDLCDEDGYIRTNDLRQIPAPMRRCIDGIKCKQVLDPDGNIVAQQIELKLTSKIAALDLLMRHMGLLDHKGDSTGEKADVDWDALLERGQRRITESGLVEE